MPKFKPHKGLRKRIKITAKGKVLHKRAFAGHLMSGKSGKRCRQARNVGVLTGAEARRVKKALGL
jgi:large subunit ribosomal protein L35